MALPLLAIIAAGMAVKAATDMYGNVRQSRFNDRQMDAAKRDARRSAIERAMGGTSLSRGPTIIKPPDLTIPGAIGGVANVAGNVAGYQYGKSP